MRTAPLVLALAIMTTLAACGAEDNASADVSIQFHPDAPNPIDTGKPSMNKSWPGMNYPDHIGKPKSGYVFVQPQLFADRYSYYADESTAQFYALLDRPEEGLDDHQVVFKVRARNRKLVASAQSAADDHRISFIVDLRSVPAGRYTAEAAFTKGKSPKPINSATFAFEKLDKPHPIKPIAFPADGVELKLEAQSFVADASWPVVAGIALPRGAIARADELTVYENGKPIPADIYERAHWDPAHRSVKWVHVHFQGRYQNGEALTYRLKRAKGNADSSLKVQETADRIEVDTGEVRFTVNRRKFAGIETLGHQGQGVVAAAPSAGPYLVDQNGVRYETSADGDVKVELELNGRNEVTIAADGWYVAPNGDKLCRFVTRISAYADQPMLRVRHYTTLTQDAHQVQLADLGFEIPVSDVEGIRFGADGDAHDGQAGETYIHQDRYDHFRTIGLKAPAEGGKSDGWFTLDRGANGAVHLFVRDIWQKYPKEVGLGKNGFSLHFWPKHGHEVYPLEAQLENRRIYKFLCFHQGKLMDLKTPQAYLDRFIEYGGDKKSFRIEGSHRWWRESERDGTKSGNAQGVTIGNEFALTFSNSKDDDPTAMAKLFLFDPIAHATPQWNCSTKAMGDLAAPDGSHFTDIEEAIEQGWLSWTRQVERYNEYGMFNYADTHTIYRIVENRPGLHRVWQGSHYRNVGTNWLLWHRYGSPAILRWARANTDHYMNIKTTNYVNTEDPIAVRDHELGAMQHMGWKTQWASSGRGEAWGQFKDVLGHFIDPEAPLSAWLMTGNRRGKQNFENWLATTKGKLRSYLWGTAREVNTSLAYLIGAYETTWDPTLLPNIHSLGMSLRSTPLEKQRPGPLWHALWINRYHELTRDPAYEPVIHKYAEMWTGVESSSTMGLAARSYDLSDDPALMRRLLPPLSHFSRGYFRKEGDLYDWWGKGPGPLGDSYVSMLWGYYRARLERAGITAFPPNNMPRGGYPYTSARPTYFNHPASLTIYALEEKDQPLEVKFGLRALGGSLHMTSSAIFGPRGGEIHKIERVGSNDDKNVPLTFDADGQTGIYRIEFRGHEAAVPLPQTQHLEVAAIDGDTSYKVLSSRLYVQPRFGDRPVTLKVIDFPNDAFVHYFVETANGKRVADGHVFAARGMEEVDIKLDPADAPWVVDLIGKGYVRFESEGPLKLLCGPDAESIKEISDYLENNTLR